MTGGAITMMLFGIVVLWGGFGVCVNIARKKENEAASKSNI